MIIIQIMNLLRVLKINLEDTRCWFPFLEDSHPFEFSNKRISSHCSTLEIVCIKISDELWWLAWIVIFNHLIAVWFWVSICHHWDTSTSSWFRPWKFSQFPSVCQDSSLKRSWLNYFAFFVDECVNNVFTQANVFFLNVWDPFHIFPSVLSRFFMKRIISTQVVKDHWTNFGFLKLRSQFVVSYSTILFCEMTVVSHFVIITIFEFLFANTTDLWIFEMFHVCICEDHILQKIELFPNHLELFH